jgi:hypothetical protein
MIRSLNAREKGQALQRGEKAPTLIVARTAASALFGVNHGLDDADARPGLGLSPSLAAETARRDVPSVLERHADQPLAVLGNGAGLADGEREYRRGGTCKTNAAGHDGAGRATHTPRAWRDRSRDDEPG